MNDFVTKFLAPQDLSSDKTFHTEHILYM